MAFWIKFFIFISLTSLGNTLTISPSEIYTDQDIGIKFQISSEHCSKDLAIVTLKPDLNLDKVIGTMSNWSPGFPCEITVYFEEHKIKTYRFYVADQKATHTYIIDTNFPPQELKVSEKPTFVSLIRKIFQKLSSKMHSS